MQPHFEGSVKILELAALNKIRILLSETSLANLIYLTFDIYKLKDSTFLLTEFLKVCELAHADKDIILKALQSTFKDKEDAIQYFTAIQSGAEFFVTRNSKDYSKHKLQSLPVFSPIELVSKF